MDQKEVIDRYWQGLTYRNYPHLHGLESSLQNDRIGDLEVYTFLRDTCNNNKKIIYTKMYILATFKLHNFLYFLKEKEKYQYQFF